MRCPSSFPPETQTVSNSRVLVLNQSYEPMFLCSAKKAIILLLLTKAELVAGRDGKLIRSLTKSYPFPSVIRMQNYIRVPFRKVDLSRKNIIRRDGYTCQYCGKKSTELTIDHIIPKSRGGSDSWENLVGACKACNNKKSNHTPEEAGMKLRTIPRKPNHIMFIQQYCGYIEQKWRPFLFLD